MKTKVFLYAEGGFKLGLGNIYRTIALAKEFIKKGIIELYFITSSESYVKNIIKNQSIEVISFKNHNFFIDIIKGAKPDILIIDNINIQDELVKSIRVYVKKLVHIGNISNANRYADLVVNAIIGTNYKNKISIDRYNTKYLEGPKYLVLRDEFYEKKNNYKYKRQLNKILLSFGGTDQANLTTKVLNKLNRIKIKKEIDIILGAGFKFVDELNREISGNNIHSIKVFKNVSNISDMMLNTDLLFTSPGTTLYEACRLKIPAISFYQNKEQEEMHRAYKFALDFHELMNFEEYIRDFYECYDLYLKYIKEFHFGEGKDEIIENCIV